jgi:hypothetical protein
MRRFLLGLTIGCAACVPVTPVSPSPVVESTPPPPAPSRCAAIDRSTYAGWRAYEACVNHP